MYYCIIVLQSPTTTYIITAVSGGECRFTLNMMGSADHGGCFTFTGLNPNTTYTATLKSVHFDFELP